MRPVITPGALALRLHRKAPSCPEQWLLRQAGSGLSDSDQLGAWAGRWLIPPRGPSRPAWRSSRVGIFQPRLAEPGQTGQAVGGERALQEIQSSLGQLPWSHQVTLGRVTASHTRGPRLPTRPGTEAGVLTPPGLGTMSPQNRGRKFPRRPPRGPAQGSTDKGSRPLGSRPPQWTQVTAWAGLHPRAPGANLAQISACLPAGPSCRRSGGTTPPKAAAARPSRKCRSLPVPLSTWQRQRPRKPDLPEVTHG